MSQTTKGTAMATAKPRKVAPPPMEPAPKAAVGGVKKERREPFDRDYVAPSPDSQKLLTKMMAMLKPAKGVAVKTVLKDHVLPQNLLAPPEDKVSLSHATSLKDADNKVVAVVFVVTPMSFLKKPKKSKTAPKLAFLYPVKKKAGSGIELRFKAVDTDRFYGDITVSQVDPKKSHCVAVDLRGKAYQELDTFQKANLMMQFVFSRGSISAVGAYVVERILRDGRNTSYAKGRALWAKSAQGKPVHIAHQYLRVSMKQGGRSETFCGVEVIVNLLEGDRLDELHGNALKKFTKDNPALAKQLKKTGRLTGAACKVLPF
ncbi:MAG: hypothetical protein ABI333_18295 [bacterium]